MKLWHFQVSPHVFCSFWASVFGTGQVSLSPGVAALWLLYLKSCIQSSQGAVLGAYI